MLGDQSIIPGAHRNGTTTIIILTKSESSMQWRTRDIMFHSFLPSFPIFFWESRMYHSIFTDGSLLSLLRGRLPIGAGA